METAAKRTWRPTTAGILNIISGAINVFNVVGLIIVITAIDTWTFLLDIIPAEDLPLVESLINTILIACLVLSIIHVVFPIVGGMFALQRKKWGWALTGSIVAILAVFPLGVASTVFVAVAKDEFE